MNFPFTINHFDYYLAGFLNFLIFSVLVITSTVLFVGFLVCFLPKSKRMNSYFFPFTSATLLVIGTFGFYSEAQEKLNSYFGHDHLHNHLHDHHHEEQLSETFSIGMKMLVFFTGILLGTLMFLILRYLFSRKLKYQEVTEETSHNHSDLLITKQDLNDPKKA